LRLFELRASLKAKQRELDRMAATMSLCHRRMSVHVGERLTSSTASGVMPSESPFSPDQQGQVLIYRHCVDRSHHNLADYVDAGWSETEIWSTVWALMQPKFPLSSTGLQGLVLIYRHIFG